MVLRRFNAIAAVSDEVKDRLVVSGPRRHVSRPLPMGLTWRLSQVSRRRCAMSPKKIIGVVARLDWQKGFACLLPAVRELEKSFSGFKRCDCGRWARPRRNRTDDTRLWSGKARGARRPAVKYACCICRDGHFCSAFTQRRIADDRAGGHGGIAAGDSHTHGRIPGVISDGATGLLVNPGDADGLKDAMARLLSDIDLCRRMGEQGHAWISRHYTSDAMALQYGSCMTRCWAARAPAAVHATTLDRSSAGATSA